MNLNFVFLLSLQPVRDTREKQIQLWKELIIDYCKSQKIFVIGLEEDFPLFSNPAIERSLSHEAREAFLSTLVSDGRAEWIDKGHRKCLILWHRIQDWADLILHFVRENGLEDSVMTVEEIRSGTESRGTGNLQLLRIYLFVVTRICYSFCYTPSPSYVFIFCVYGQSFTGWIVQFLCER
nr:vacuolar protein sorting-associated protein 25 [Ipomoea batatas]